MNIITDIKNKFIRKEDKFIVTTNEAEEFSNAIQNDIVKLVENNNKA